MRSRTVIIGLLTGLFVAGPFLSGVAPTAEAQTRSLRKVRHDVRQANLYLKMKLPARARELLTETVADEPGLSDPLAWLALGRAYYHERRIDDAGRSVERARGLGLQRAIGDRKWPRRFLAAYDRHVGALILDGGRCEELSFSARLAAPMPSSTRKALLDSAPGWRSGRLTRKSGVKFYLPVGRYRFGALKVKVLPGEMARVSAQEVGAECRALPGLARAPGAPGHSASALPTSQVAQVAREDKSWFESNWGWVLLGVAVVAGGTATAVGLATSGGPDQLTFDSNPSSFRDN